MIYLIGLNGPPRCGKDTIAAAMREILSHETDTPIIIKHTSSPMRLRVYAMLSMTYSVDHYEFNKDKPQHVFGGRSIRDVMILDSEKFVTPRFGQNFWAASLVNGLREIDFQGIAIVPDIGFAREADYYDMQNDVRFENIQISRPKIDWGNDSRSYIPSNYERFSNDRKPVDLAETIISRLRSNPRFHF